jgi:hypothetical protein
VALAHRRIPMLTGQVRMTSVVVRLFSPSVRFRCAGGPIRSTSLCIALAMVHFVSGRRTLAVAVPLLALSAAPHRWITAPPGLTDRARCPTRGRALARLLDGSAPRVRRSSHCVAGSSIARARWRVHAIGWPRCRMQCRLHGAASPNQRCAFAHCGARSRRSRRTVS